MKGLLDEEGKLKAGTEIRKVEDKYERYEYDNSGMSEAAQLTTAIVVGSLTGGAGLGVIGGAALGSLGSAGAISGINGWGRGGGLEGGVKATVKTMGDNEVLKDAAIAGISSWITVNANAFAKNKVNGNMVGNALIKGGAQGINTELFGGKFKDGLALGAGVSLIADMARAMRKQMIEQSKELPGNDGTGKSQGMDEDGFKLAGERCSGIACKEGNADNIENIENKDLGGLTGGWQDQKGTFFGIEYDPKGLIGGRTDSLMESYAGPHDWLANVTGGYNKDGSGVGGIDNFILSVINLLPATPFAIGHLADINMRNRWIYEQNDSCKLVMQSKYCGK